MALTSEIDIYCERIGAGFWSEPVNAFTNAAFILAAWLVAGAIADRQARGEKFALDLRLLAPVLALVGLCSFLFHSFATVWAALADTLSILLFGCVYLFAFLRHVVRLNNTASTALVVAFAVVSYLFPRVLPPGFLNGSGGYFPYLAGMLALAAFLFWDRRETAAKQFVGVIALFGVSLFFRTVDANVCAAFPLGTHFLWHLFNALMLYLFTRILLREHEGARPQPLSGRDEVRPLSDS